MGISTGLLVSMGVVGLGAGITAKAQRDTGRAAQEQANRNAQIAELQATDAIARGIEDENRLRIRSRRLIGSQRAAFAASGIDITDADSTAVNVFADTAEQTEIDARTIRANAAREAWGYKVQADDYLYKGRIARYEGDTAAIGTVLSTAGSVLYSKYGFGSTSRGRTTV